MTLLPTPYSLLPTATGKINIFAAVCSEHERIEATDAMSEGDRNLVENKLLAALPQKEYARLLPKLTTVSLGFKQVLYETGAPIEHVYFLNNSVVSLLTPMADGAAIEVATVGNEGMLGLPVFLGGDTIPMNAIAQVPGQAMRMQAEQFQGYINQGEPLHNLLQRYAQALLTQISLNAACNRLHCVEKRFCRWLLLTHDRVRLDQFPLTQEFLSQMLGVRRASVGEVAIRLQQAGLIRYSRGKITILNRLGLEASSCECYQIVKQEFDRLLG